MVPVLIALGSNLGDRRANLQRAVDLLAGAAQWRELSPLFESEPAYLEDQPTFFNAVGLAETPLGPLELLTKLKQVETAVGRQKRVQNGPRELDLDVLAYGSLWLSSPGLNLPHPRWRERAFVVEPIRRLQVPLPPSIQADLPPAEGLLGPVSLVHDAVLQIPG
jgi:2-amino-4-hydroxy-6-hydroxymethyldihydropteridine diphosphokinase